MASLLFCPRGLIMDLRKLGRTNLEVTSVCLGTMTWGEQNTESDAHEQLDYALGRGINFIDTAEMYPVPSSDPIWKAGRTEEIVGIDFKDLVGYLEKKFKPGMTLSNYGKWHIDHIKPVTKFDLTISGELEKCFHYTNLQPLWAVDNLKKGKKF